MIRAAMLMLAAVPLGGCTVTLNTTGICAAEHAQGYVGQVYRDSIERRIRDLSLAMKTRTVRPGDVVTMDFNKRRVNIAVDENNRVSRIYCG